MKIQLMSDLHFEFGWKMKLTEMQDVTLVLAGDVDSDPDRLEEFIRYACTNRRAVIMIAGNHEFYGNNYEDVIWNLDLLADEIDNFHFLENEHVILDGINFIGATLWSEPDWGVFRKIADSAQITFGNRHITDKDIASMCRQSKKYITKAIREIEGKKVVITHFGPDQALMHPKWLAYPNMNTYFWAHGLQDTFKDADYWFFGHTHDPIDMKIDGCQFVCNPNGYVWPGGAGREHWNFNENLILDI